VAILVRFARLTEFADAASWRHPTAIPEPALRHFRGSRLSVYRLDNIDDIPRLVAAFSLLHREGLKAQSLLFVDEQFLAARGIFPIQTTGNLPDTLASSWHHEMPALSEAQVAETCFEFACNGTPIKYSISDVMRCVVDSYNNGCIVADALHQKAADGLSKALRRLAQS
jgi:hypothetical protein